MKRLVVLLVAIAACVALAGAFLPSDAATVGQSSISRQSLDSDLSAIAGSSDYVCFLSEERQLTESSTSATVTVVGAGAASTKGGIYDATFVDSWLASMITDTVTARLVSGHGIHVTAADLSLARGVLTRRITDVLETYARDTEASSSGCGGSGQVVLSSLPAWFQSQQIRAEATEALLDARAAGSGLSSGDIGTYFARHRASFDKDCLDAVIVETSSAATKVESALSSGATFAHEAQAESITQTSAADGGAVGCGYLEGTFLATAVGKLEVGAVSPPVSGDGYYWVVKLASRTTVPLATARSTVVTAILHAGANRADDELVAALRSSKVGVDPRYGTASADSVTLVLPAASPPAGAELSSAANLPKRTAAGS